ncbi:hypothetical protein [Candidatus Regiella insecticola]|nr:hypothetical protein [Candidatus Regiella insecticola]
MPKVIFDNIGVQIRKKTDQGQDLVEDSNDPDAYLNLSKLSGVIENQPVAIADLSGINRSALETLILPWSPRVKINPSYAETDFITWRNDREFDALRYFAAKDPHFVFEYYQHPTPVKELISPVLTGIRESVGVGWMAINKLQSNYEKTEVNVYFGNNDYKLMAPGIKENEK